MSFEKLGKFDVEQPDGAVWTTFYDRTRPDDQYLIVTSSGRELFLGEKGTSYRGLRRMFSDYHQDEINDQASAKRKYLGKGQQATVFGMDWLAVREIPGRQGVYRTLGELTSMDELATIVEEGLPRWLKVPHMYACYADPEKQKRYMLMEKVDTGLTIEDVLDYPNVNQHSADRVVGELGRTPTDEDRETLRRLFDRSYHILSTVIKAKGKDPDDYLVDWEPRNVLVESLRTPVASENFSLSIIDQYN